MEMTPPSRAYWQERSDLNYYRVVRDQIEAIHGDSILDVGCMDTPVATWGEFRNRRTGVNLAPVAEDRMRPGMDYWFGDFMELPTEGNQFSVVTCLQVLEHLSDGQVGLFAWKLFDHAEKAVIISVPWQWPPGACAWHPQDPVNLAKIRRWTGREPDEFRIAVDGGLRRAICGFFST